MLTVSEDIARHSPVAPDRAPFNNRQLSVRDDCVISLKTQSRTNLFGHVSDEQRSLFSKHSGQMPREFRGTVAFDVLLDLSQ